MHAVLFALAASAPPATGDTNIGWVGLATSYVLVLIAIVISLWQGLGIERSIIWASFRALVQLLAVGAVLVVVLDAEQPIAVAFGWVGLMIVVAAVTVHLRVPEIPGSGWLAAAAIGTATAVGLGVMLGLHIFPVEGRTIVPLSGMIVGNALASAVLVSRRLVAEVSEKRTEIEARLALGQSRQVASKPYVRSALRTSLLPLIERTKIVGLVALPGAMTGLILAGVDPAAAVKIQAAVMFELLGAEAAAVTVVALGLSRRLFTPDHRLVRISRTEA
jgi:putative ABC transport system permease protein